MAPLVLLLLGCHRPPPPPEAGVLHPCWSTPNCVSSQADPSDSHHIAPLPLHGAPETAARRLGEVVTAMEGAREVVVETGRVRATFVTPSGLFTDDVDLVVDATEAVVHVRSSSRLGIGDNGVNRARVEALRAAWGAP